MPTVPRVGKSKQLQQRRLAGAGRADDGDALAASHMDARPAQHLQRHAALDEFLHQIHPLEHGIV
jgi:hypothetical protein